MILYSYIAYTSQYLVRLSYLVFQRESLLRICSVLLVIESMLLLQQNGSVLLVLVWFKLDMPLQRPTFHAYIKM